MLVIHECHIESDEGYKEWEVANGDEFRSLKYLQFNSLNLVHWRADETNFPRLQHLSIILCYKLQEIPDGIGEIPTLQLIEMFQCSASACSSAREIQKVQQSEFDNHDHKLGMGENARESDSTQY